MLHRRVGGPWHTGELLDEELDIVDLAAGFETVGRGIFDAHLGNHTRRRSAHGNGGRREHERLRASEESERDKEADHCVCLCGVHERARRRIRQVVRCVDRAGLSAME